MAAEELVAVVDASGQVMGRLASKVAKMLLEGYTVHVVNAPEALISGDRRSIIEEWKEFLGVGSIVNPEHGPYHWRRPDRILRGVIKGMLPRDRPRGREALRRLRVYNDYPDALRRAGMDPMRFEDAAPRRPRLLYITLGELARELGWRGR
ncbi:MAG: 50S ribosomal protein L13 [Nitrososphaeria archaeon]